MIVSAKMKMGLTMRGGEVGATESCPVAPPLFVGTIHVTMPTVLRKNVAMILPPYVIAVGVDGSKGMLTATCYATNSNARLKSCKLWGKKIFVWKFNFIALLSPFACCPCCFVNSLLALTVSAALVWYCQPGHCYSFSVCCFWSCSRWIDGWQLSIGLYWYVWNKWK